MGCSPAAAGTQGNRVLKASTPRRLAGRYAALTDAGLVAALNESLYVDGQPSAPPGRLEQLLALYPPSGDADRNLALLADYKSDNDFHCLARAVAVAAAAAAGPARTAPRAPVYKYRFDHRWASAACTDLYFAPVFGVTHTSEIS